MEVMRHGQCDHGVTAEITWYGCAGHLIVRNRCRFHLHTHVEPWCVSTVGAFFPDRHAPMDTIGSGDQEFYETMIFHIDGTSQTWKRYATEEEAHDGHKEALAASLLDTKLHREGHA